MKPLFEVKAVDCEFYEKRLRDWLPDKIMDIRMFNICLVAHVSQAVIRS